MVKFRTIVSRIGRIGTGELALQALIGGERKQASITPIELAKLKKETLI